MWEEEEDELLLWNGELNDIRGGKNGYYNDTDSSFDYGSVSHVFSKQ